MDGDVKAERRVVAINPSRDSENRIHADDVAGRYGFRGGLVPGVTVYGYLAGLLVDTLGEEWVARGRTEVRFRSPCYEGDELLLRLHGDGALEVGAGGAVCVTGRVAAGDPRVAGGGGPGIPTSERPDPADRPLVSSERLATGTVLGSVPLDTTTGAVDAYERRIGETPAILGQEGWIHPGMLLEAANLVLMANVVMPLWLHVGSDIGHLRPVSVGEPVEVRARVAGEWEQKGHRFVTLDVEWVALEGGELPLVATATHTAIWQLAGA